MKLRRSSYLHVCLHFWEFGSVKRGNKIVILSTYEMDGCNEHCWKDPALLFFVGSLYMVQHAMQNEESRKGKILVILLILLFGYYFSIIVSKRPVNKNLLRRPPLTDSLPAGRWPRRYSRNWEADSSRRCSSSVSTAAGTNWQAIHGDAWYLIRHALYYSWCCWWYDCDLLGVLIPTNSICFWGIVKEHLPAGCLPVTFSKCSSVAAKAVK